MGQGVAVERVNRGGFSAPAEERRSPSQRARFGRVRMDRTCAESANRRNQGRCRSKIAPRGRSASKAGQPQNGNIRIFRKRGSTFFFVLLRDSRHEHGTTSHLGEVLERREHRTSGPADDQASEYVNQDRSLRVDPSLLSSLRYRFRISPDSRRLSTQKASHFTRSRWSAEQGRTPREFSLAHSL